jgi:hypothetical protein
MAATLAAAPPRGTYLGGSRHRALAAGVDFATVAQDGRLRAATGFLGPVA